MMGGHRLCAGCPAPTIAKLAMMCSDKEVVVSNATGCLEVSTTIYPYSAWKTPWIHTAFENTAANIAGVEVAFHALKKKGLVDKDFRFMAIAGDGGTYDIGLQALSGAIERGHRFVYICYDNEAYMNCLSLSSEILTVKGLKNITEIRKGDELYAMDIEIGNWIIKKCSGVYDNGVKEIFEINTDHHTIKATSNHPFLTLERNGRGKENKLVWKTLQELRKYDQIVASKSISKEKSFKFDKISLSVKGDYKVNKINSVVIPSVTDEELMELIGLYVGDGWTRIDKGETGFAIPSKDKARKRLIEIIEKRLKPSSVTAGKDYVYVYSVNLVKFIKSLSLGDSAKTKTIPSWIFTLPLKEKEAFIKGLMLSDGYTIGKSNRYVSASKILLKRLRLLLQTMDYRVGKIHIQKKLKGTLVVKRKLLKDSEYGYICFSRKSSKNIEKYVSQYKYNNFLFKNKYFELEKIKSIESRGKEPTLDLQVDGAHNFIADGLVVHNTGVQRSSATPLYAQTTTDPIGSSRKGKQELRKNFTEIMVAHNMKYIAQTSLSNLNDFTMKMEKAFKATDYTATFVNVLSPCIPGWGIKDDDAVKLSKIAVDTCFWPLYEVEDGVYKLSYNPEESGKKLPIVEFLKGQSRFKHFFKPGNEHLIEQFQKDVDNRWEQLKKKCGVK